MRRERPDPIALLTGRLNDGPRPKAIRPSGEGGKFSPDGTAEPYPGNTVICHIDRTSEAFRQLVALQNALKAGRHAARFTFLPPHSFHMTVFDGVTERCRGLSRWPRDIAPDASMAAVTDEIIRRIIRIEAPLRYEVKVEGLFAGFSVTVSGATAEHEASLRNLRDRLRDAIGADDPEHDDYGFHITLAYQVSWVDGDAARDIVALSDAIGAEFAAKVPVIALGRPEICTFATMHRFDPIAHLTPQGLVRLGDGSRDLRTRADRRQPAR